MTNRDGTAIVGALLMACAVVMFGADVRGWPVVLGLGLGALAALWMSR